MIDDVLWNSGSLLGIVVSRNRETYLSIHRSGDIPISLWFAASAINLKFKLTWPIMFQGVETLFCAMKMIRKHGSNDSSKRNIRVVWGHFMGGIRLGFVKSDKSFKQTTFNLLYIYIYIYIHKIRGWGSGDISVLVNWRI